MVAQLGLREEMARAGGEPPGRQIWAVGRRHGGETKPSRSGWRHGGSSSSSREEPRCGGRPDLGRRWPARVGEGRRRGLGPMEDAARAVRERRRAGGSDLGGGRRQEAPGGEGRRHGRPAGGARVSYGGEAAGARAGVRQPAASGGRGRQGEARCGGAPWGGSLVGKEPAPFSGEEGSKAARS